MKFVFLLLCTCLVTKASCLSMLELEIQYIGIMEILKREQNTTRQLKLEISELKKERVDAQIGTVSSGSTLELFDKLDKLSAKLDSLKSGLEVEKLERYGILEDLREVKMWTKDIVTDKGKEWKNAIANFSIGSGDRQRQGCQELKVQLSNELEKTQADLRTQQGQITELEEAKSDFRGQQKQMITRLDSVYESLKCQKGWIKKDCVHYKVFKLPKPYDEANATCAGLGAKLIRRKEVSGILEMLFKKRIYEMWVEKESANDVSCGIYRPIRGDPGRNCSQNLPLICVKK